jgi:hypothetical protein
MRFYEAIASTPSFRWRERSERCYGCGLVGVELGVLGNADHGEDFGEVGSETADGDGLAGFAGFHEDLDDERDAGGVEVFDAFEVDQDALVGGLVERLVGANDGVLGGRGDVSAEAEAGDLLASCAGELLLRDLIRGLHLIHTPCSSG